jgi:MFS transporter, Spinster family, sphingosine-1-phosphate transporter
MTARSAHQSSVEVPARERRDEYLFGPPAAWMAYALTLALMLFNYADRQVIVSVFPYLKTQWSLSDTQLGALVSVVSITVAIAGIPIALVADRTSRVKSIVAMAITWSAATVATMFARGYGQLVVIRALVGLGEAGYGSVGTALIATHFPSRLRGTVLAGFFAAASIGNVLGVMIGGVIAVRFGWRAAFGVVGVPGLLLALLFLKVRDYRTAAPDPGVGTWRALARRMAAFVSAPALRWVCLGAAAQLILVSAVWSWLPTYLNRYYGMAPDQAAVRAALVVLVGGLGSLVWGRVVDRAGKPQPHRRLYVVAFLCVVSAGCAAAAFGATQPSSLQLALIGLAGFMFTCTVGPAAAVVMDIVHPSVRSAGAALLSLFQNLLGLASGSFIAGVLSDRYSLATSLTVVPVFACLAALLFVLAARSYDSDRSAAREALAQPAP